MGNTGLLVSTLCLGTMTFGDGQGVYQHIGNIGQSDADKLVETGIRHGSGYFRL
jgi:aryl-alcohol dehydrogenase-like predicted oxidoreductase